MIKRDRLRRINLKPNFLWLTLITAIPLIGFILYLVGLVGKTESSPVATVNISAFTPPQPSSDWIYYENTSELYSFYYPPFWKLISFVPDNVDDCAGIALSTVSENSWLTLCPIDAPFGISGLKTVWESKTKVVERYVGGYPALQFEYKQTTNQYEYFVIMEKGNQSDLLQIHLITDVGEKESAKVIFDKLISTLNFQ
ncbi:MAG: hypothetical protein UW80_C0053G0009 [Microgenomates group bacterium GW2011_GWC1_44_9]|nr:MAG: hypothetical protein UW80_C0053G0009 [Microgenomates group bacterium GW2011_GWC1_44_9]